MVCAAWLFLSILAPSDEAWGDWSALGPFAYSWEAKAQNVLPFGELERFEVGGEGPDREREFGALHGGSCSWSELVGTFDGKALDVGLISIADALPPAAGALDARVFLHRSVEATTRRRLELAIGSDDGLRLWWNGRLLLDQQVLRALSLGDSQVELELEPGTNHLVVEVSQKGGGWGFRMAEVIPADEDTVDRAIVRGVRWLLDQQLIDGSWGAWPGYKSGHAAYTAYVLLKMGLPPAHPALRRALAFARARPGDFTYSVACEVLALAEIGDEADREWLERRTHDLVDWQASSGQYGYPLHPDGNPRATPDLSNTLYAALALDAAAARGVRVPKSTWKEMVKGTLRNLGRETEVSPPYGAAGPAVGFYYWPGKAVSGSMTTAGLSILALAERTAGKKLARSDRTEIEEVRERGLRWIAANLDYSTNPGDPPHHYFFLYGVERTASLLGLAEIGGIDWYEEGARYLVNAQKENGSWGADPPVDTLLALLFLKRASAPRSRRSALFSSAEIAVNRTDFDEVWERYPHDAAASVWPTEGMTFEASSSSAGTPDRAFDRNHTTAWMPQKDDAQPWIQMTLRRPLRGGRLLLSHARPRLADAEARRAARVAVALGDEKELVVLLEPSVEHKTEVDLGKTRFRTLRVRILACEGDAAKGDGIGFSEIELLTNR